MFSPTIKDDCLINLDVRDRVRRVDRDEFDSRLHLSHATAAPLCLMPNATLYYFKHHFNAHACLAKNTDCISCYNFYTIRITGKQGC